MNFSGYDAKEKKLFQKLNSPKKIQDYLNTLRNNFEEHGDTCYSPRRVIIQKKAHCMEGAMLAAAVLEFHGQRPLVLDLRSQAHDFDHVVAVFKQFKCFGAISKTNHAVLRYREPVYRSIRELAMSFFHEYFDSKGKKTLREYSKVFDLNYFNRLEWRTAKTNLFKIPDYLDKIKHFKILLPAQAKNLRLADKIEIKAGEIVEWKNNN